MSRDATGEEAFIAKWAKTTQGRHRNVCFDVHCYHCSLAAIACKFWLSGCGKTLSSPSSTILYVDFFGSRILEDVAAISCVTLVLQL